MKYFILAETIHIHIFQYFAEKILMYSKKNMFKTLFISIQYFHRTKYQLNTRLKAGGNSVKMGTPWSTLGNNGK